MRLVNARHWLVLVATLLAAAAGPARAQQPILDLSAGTIGVTASVHARSGENFKGRMSAFGFWADVGSDRWRLDFDVSRSSNANIAATLCVDPLCTRTTIEQWRQRDWVINVAALRRVPTATRVVPHVFGGGGALISSTTAASFANVQTRGSVVAGAGVDVLPASVLLLRLQYRVNVAGLRLTQQLRFGAGVSF